LSWKIRTLTCLSQAAWGATALQGSSASGQRRTNQGRHQGIEKEVQDLGRNWHGIIVTFSSFSPRVNQQFDVENPWKTAVGFPRKMINGGCGAEPNTGGLQLHQGQKDIRRQLLESRVLAQNHQLYISW